MKSSIITLYDMGFNNLRKKVEKNYTYFEKNDPKVVFLKNFTHFEILQKFLLVNFYETLHNYSTYHID